MRFVFWCGLFLTVLSSSGVSECQQSDREFPTMFKCGEDGGRRWRSGKVATYSGFYEAEFEGSSFKLSHAPCEVWLTGDVCPIFKKGKCVKGAKVKAYVTVEGVMSDSGHFGHFGLWERELRVTHVVKVQRIKE